VLDRDWLVHPAMSANANGLSDAQIAVVVLVAVWLKPTRPKAP
jgi:hypothetical protein